MMNQAGINDELVTVLYTGDEEECVNLVKQAREDLDQHENKIDEEWNGHAIGDYATRKFDLCHPRVSHHGLTSPHCFPDGSSQAVVQDAWVAAGAEYDKAGFCKLNGCYLVACTSVFGEVGDRITFYFDDGSSIDAIKIDAEMESETQSDHDFTTKWGCDDGHCVLGFCGKDKIGDNPYATLGKDGCHTTSWTNHGKGVDVGAEMGGSASGASSVVSGLANKRAASAIEECRAETKFDNSTLAAALVSYSYSRSKAYDGTQWKGTDLYLEVWHGVFPGDGYPRSDGRSVASAIRWCGADKDFPSGNCAQQREHCFATPSLWKHIGDFQASAGGATAASEAKDWGLEPGDILICDDHIMAYVGKEAVSKGYERNIRGTDADVGAPGADDAFVSGSNSPNDDSGAGSHAPAISDGQDFAEHTYAVFRYVGNYPDRDKYADLGTSTTLSSTPVSGTACDCEVECKKSGAEEMAAFAVSIATGGVDTGAITDEEADAVGCTVAGGRLHVPNPPNAKYGKNGEVDGLAAARPMLDWWHEEQELGRAGLGTYGPASCSPWIGSAIKRFELDSDISEDTAANFVGYEDIATYFGGDYNRISAVGEWLYMLHRPDIYELVHCGTDHGAEVRGVTRQADEDLDEICEPGDILARPIGHSSAGHILMYVGNDLARTKYPTTTGNCVESNENGGCWPGITSWKSTSGYDVFRIKTSHSDCES